MAVFGAENVDSLIRVDEVDETLGEVGTFYAYGDEVAGKTRRQFGFLKVMHGNVPIKTHTLFARQASARRPLLRGRDTVSGPTELQRSKTCASTQRASDVV
jgi:hypothetical protein